MLRRCLVLCLIGLWVAPVTAVEPNLRNVNVRGLQVGGTTTLVVDGDELGTSPRLLFSFPARQKLKPGSTATQATFEVTLDDTVPPGFAFLRVVTDGGVSPPVAIALDRLPQRPLTAQVETIPAALHGAVSGSSIAEMKFTGKAGQKVLIEIEAQRLGSKLRPVVHLYNAKRRQLDWSWSLGSLGGDTRLEATLPEDGIYTVTVHDTEYAGASPGFFRLKVGQWAYVDQLFPPVVGKEQKTVELVGSPATTIELPATRTALILPLTWPRAGNWSGPRPFVTTSSRPEILEQISSDKGQDVPAGALGITGRLLKPGEEDRYRVPVKAGTKVRFEVFAERLGSPLDVSLVLRNEMGAEIARVEDSPGTLDAFLEYTVPDKVTSVLVCVADAQERGSARGIYRLLVDPVTPGAAKGDWQLTTTARRLTLPVGGRVLVPVLIDRRGYTGSVTLTAEGLPGGVKLDAATIPPGTDGVLVTVQRGDGAADAVITNWRGRGDDGQERSVVLKGEAMERWQPWLASELALAPTTDKAVDFQIDWRGLPPDAGLIPAAKLTLPVKVVRPATPALVRLTLVTSQAPPLVNNQPDPNQTLRPEKPVELAAKIVDGDLVMLVPPQLNGPTYDVAIQAELLSPDRARVLATAYTPVRRLAVRLPVALQLQSPPRLEAKLDPKTGATLEVKGKVERREGFTGDVALTLTGIPAGTRADPVTVKAGTTDFIVKLILPANVIPGEVSGLKLSGTIVPDAKQPNVRVRSRDVELTLVVQPAR